MIRKARIALFALSRNDRRYRIKKEKEPQGSFSDRSRSVYQWYTILCTLVLSPRVIFR